MGSLQKFLGIVVCAGNAILLAEKTGYAVRLISLVKGPFSLDGPSVLHLGCFRDNALARDSVPAWFGMAVGNVLRPYLENGPLGGFPDALPGLFGMLKKLLSELDCCPRVFRHVSLLG